MLTQKDFEEIGEMLADNSEHYRERFLSVKLSLYSGLLTFNGITIAVATLIASRETSGIAVSSFLVICSLVSCGVMFVNYHWFLSMYDALGYTRTNFKRPEDIEKYWANLQRVQEQFKRRRLLRRFGDWLLYAVAILQIGAVIVYIANIISLEKI